MSVKISQGDKSLVITQFMRAQFELSYREGGPPISRFTMFFQNPVSGDLINHLNLISGEDDIVVEGYEDGVILPISLVDGIVSIFEVTLGEAQSRLEIRGTIVSTEDN